MHGDESAISSDFQFGAASLRRSLPILGVIEREAILLVARLIALYANQKRSCSLLGSLHQLTIPPTENLWHSHESPCWHRCACSLVARASDDKLQLPSVENLLFSCLRTHFRPCPLNPCQRTLKRRQRKCNRRL